ncbi:LysR family transcriptional regulator [Raoultella sp. BIGb0149]|uniref:LysR family transcriptional regulator n=1 Tax=Raoultella sp. BIGb0149 TaxID=2485116 RepID=UPI00105F0372|nr:LysR family transcriptional regulator [Raoultella sp. BIGb0149]TDQ26770.1 LysR family transcriptional regulator [Raoultella sp. BIGb0149]
MNHLSAIRTFVSAADHKSFSAAAKALNIEVSTASRHISELEEYLQVTLFNRSTRGLTLTETGDFFYSHARQLLLQWEEARHLTSALDKHPSGLLRISVPSTFGRLHVMPFVDEFLRLHPNISLDISFNDEIQDLIEARIDLSIRIGVLPDSSIHARKLASQTRAAWASPRWIAQNSPPVVPGADGDGQKEMNIVMFSRLHGAGWYTRRAGSEDEWQRIPINYRLSVSDSAAMLYACCNHGGIAILPNWLSREEEEKGHIQRVFPDWEFSMFPSETAIWMLYPQKRILPHKVRTFIDFMVEKVGTPPYWEDNAPSHSER